MANTRSLSEAVGAAQYSLDSLVGHVEQLEAERDALKRTLARKSLSLWAWSDRAGRTAGDYEGSSGEMSDTVLAAYNKHCGRELHGEGCGDMGYVTVTDADIAQYPQLAAVLSFFGNAYTLFGAR